VSVISGSAVMKFYCSFYWTPHIAHMHLADALVNILCVWCQKCWWLYTLTLRRMASCVVWIPVVLGLSMLSRLWRWLLHNVMFVLGGNGTRKSSCTCALPDEARSVCIYVWCSHLLPKHLVTLLMKGDKSAQSQSINQSINQKRIKVTKVTNVTARPII